MEIKVPAIGESVLEATIAKWHKEDGEAVKKDDLLCELETDKITLELNADTDGILSIKTPEGDTVEVGAVIGTLEEGAPGEGAPKKKEEGKKVEGEVGKGAAVPEERPKAEAPKAREEKQEEKQEEKPKEPRREEPPPQPPRREEAAPAPREAQGRTTRKAMSAIRRRIAERLVEARQQTAMLTTFNEADLSRVQELRKRHQESFRKKHGAPLGLMSFFVKASVEALKEYPEVNARIDGGDIVYQHFYDIGIAIGSERGLVVPVLRDADRLSFAEIEGGIADYVEKIKTNRLNLSDLEGGTFTITNGGVYGSLLSTPILNPPQCGVLGMHAIQERPVARDGEIAIRPMMYLALSYDHRLIDGRQAVQFLKRIKEFVEEPEELLIEL
jgi:2-oxoglutarate dehydrogenase E2 component (dihydrolipoamide succinyltransferase)